MVSLKICKLPAGLNRLAELKGSTQFAFSNPEKWSLYKNYKHKLWLQFTTSNPRDIMYQTLRGMIRGWTGLNKGIRRSSITGPQIQGRHTTIEAIFNSTTLTYEFYMSWGGYAITEKLTEREMQEQIHEQPRSY